MPVEMNAFEVKRISYETKAADAPVVPLQLARTTPDGKNQAPVALQRLTDLLMLLDMHIFQERAGHFIRHRYHAEAAKHWHFCCEHVVQCRLSQAEKLLLLRRVLRSMNQKTAAQELIGFVDLAIAVKNRSGAGLFYRLFCDGVDILRMPSFSTYNQVLAILIEFPGNDTVLGMVDQHLNQWEVLAEALQLIMPWVCVYQIFAQKIQDLPILMQRLCMALAEILNSRCNQLPCIFINTLY